MSPTICWPAASLLGAFLLPRSRASSRLQELEAPDTLRCALQAAFSSLLPGLSSYVRPPALRTGRRVLAEFLAFRAAVALVAWNDLEALLHAVLETVLRRRNPRSRQRRQHRRDGQLGHLSSRELGTTCGLERPRRLAQSGR
eukprot:scaffold576_cov260-Pinguiococcus_pyrenoidosus.AAC.47